MSDASPTIGNPTPDAPKPAATALPLAAAARVDEVPRTGPAFLAAGILLAIMTAWIRSGFDTMPVAAAIVVGLAAAACFVFGAIRLFGISCTPASASFAAGCSIVLLGVAGWLGWSFGLDALGQAIGLGIFAILGLGVAVGWSGGSLRSRLPASLPTRIVLFALGAAALAGFLYLWGVRRVGPDYWPEQIFLALGGFLLLFAAVWLHSTPKPNAEFLTMFFLVVGSSLGAILTLYALSRGIMDWSKLQSEPWRGWAVGYSLVGGLALIFSSLNLAINRVGTSAVARQSIFGFATILCGILAFLALIVFNVFVARSVTYTMEWSKTRGLTTLSEASKNLLAGLDKKVEVYVLMSPQHFLHLQMKTLLDNAAAFAPSKFEVTYINPDSANVAEKKEFDRLANRFKEIVSAGGRDDQETSRGVLLVYGSIPEDPNVPVPHAVIPARRLFDEQMKTFTFKGESEVMKELDFLARKREKQRIYVLQGDNELDINGKEILQSPSPTINLTRLGSASLVEALTKDNFEVRGLSFRPADPDDKSTNIVHVGEADGKKAEVPANCATLLILGPSERLSNVALDAIERYMDRNGRLFVTLGLPGEPDYSKLRDTGLDEFLKKYGVDVTDDFVMHLASNQLPDPFDTLALVNDKNDSVLAKQFAGRGFMLSTPRIVKPGTSTKYKADPLLICDPRLLVFKEDSLLVFTSNAERYLQDKFRGRTRQEVVSPRPLPVAVTVTSDAKPRMVVIGEADFLSNAAFRTSRRRNYDLLVSSLAWMGDRGFIGPRPIESANYVMGPNADQGAMTIGAIWTMIALLLAVGGCIWIVRRR
jgi:ABC-type uncharacterized transport system